MSVSSLRIVFAGTPDFAAVSLARLLQASCDVVAVYTQPDRPAGRGRKLQASPVKQLAQSSDIPVLQPVKLDEEACRQLAEFEPDIMVVVAYGLLLPKNVLTLPRLGCVNVHASLLPKFRGAAPIQRAIIAGECETGITLMQMDEGLDTGPMLIKRFLSIDDDDTGGVLHDKLASLGGDVLVEGLAQFAAGDVVSQVQDGAQASYAAKLFKKEAQVDWREAAVDIWLKVRAFNPWPVAFSSFNGELVRFWQCSVVDYDECAAPGTILAFDKNGLLVKCGQGAVCVLQLQLSGGKVLSVVDVVHANKLGFSVGQSFDVK